MDNIYQLSRSIILVDNIYQLSRSIIECVKSCLLHANSAVRAKSTCDRIAYWGKACGLEESNFVQSDSAPGAAWAQRAQIMTLRVCAAASFSLRRLSRATWFETRSAPRIRPCNERMAASARAKAAVASCESLPLFPFKVEKTEDFIFFR